MANVDSIREERAQLLLVAALGMAVLFIALALTLNTAIYTENLATRGSDLAGGRDAVDYRVGMEHGVEPVIEVSNYNHNESATTLERNLSAGVQDIDRLSRLHSAASGELTNTSLRSHVDGSRIIQASDGNFTDDEGNSSWTVANDISGSRNFWINVSSSELTDSLDTAIFGNEVFVITFREDSGEEWNVSVYRETGVSDDISVMVGHDGSKFGPCSVSRSRARIDITGGTLGETPCPELGYLDNVTGQYSIFYNDTKTGSDQKTVNGTYELIVDEPPPSIKDGQYHDDGSGEYPHPTPAIYSATIRTVYNTTRIQYLTEFRVIPGETLAN